MNDDPVLSDRTAHTDRTALTDQTALAERVLGRLDELVLGQREACEGLLATYMAGGHALLCILVVLGAVPEPWRVSL